MDDGPFAAPAPRVCATHLDADGFHHALAWTRSVARVRGFVDVLAVQARGAVVAVFGAPGLARDLQFAVDTGEAVRLVAALMI